MISVAISPLATTNATEYPGILDPRCAVAERVRDAISLRMNEGFLALSPENVRAEFGPTGHRVPQRRPHVSGPGRSRPTRLLARSVRRAHAVTPWLPWQCGNPSQNVHSAVLRVGGKGSQSHATAKSAERACL